jgi:phospho-N-acetylmuramoyl-pentapeptide-transferase
MLKLLASWAAQVSGLNVFRYLTFRAAYALITALLLAFLFGPRVIERLRQLKAGQSVRLDGPQTHLSKSGTPTMGGIFIILAVAVSVILWQDIFNLYTWLCLGTLVGFGLIGFFDDYLKIKKRNSDGVSAGMKLGLQLLLSAIAVVILFVNRTPETTKLYIPFIKNAVIDLGWAWIPLAVLYITGWSNAVNLSDGLDGLAAGLCIIALAAVAILTYVTGRPDWAAYLQIPFVRGSTEITVFILALAGAVVGFLWFNAHPAAVFMGDVGALSIGAVMGLLGLILKKEILFLVIGGVFILEIASDIIQVASYKLAGKRVFKMAPLHHHFELSGWKETQVVTRFLILGGLFAVLALSTLKTQ